MSDRLLKESDVLEAILGWETDPLDEELERAVKAIPSADRPQAHYIKGENGEWYCSNCKRIDDKYSVANFCWYCGCRMKGTDDEDL